MRTSPPLVYNVPEARREGQALDVRERDIHDHGLVTLIRQHHDAIDALVTEAYCWPANLGRGDPDPPRRAEQGANGGGSARAVRWLRPEYQSPDY